MGRSDESKPFGVEPIPPQHLLHPDADGYVCAGPLHACPVGKAVAIASPNVRIAIFHRPEGLFAIKDACPHAEYPLSKGLVAGDVVTCASHGWQFRLATGECLRGAPGMQIRTFPVVIRNAQIWVKVTA